MDDNHDQATELALETEGSIMSEQDAKDLSKSEEINYPMPGEIPTAEEESQHSHHMPGVEERSSEDKES
jgi:hypothetical protein